MKTLIERATTLLLAPFCPSHERVLGLLNRARAATGRVALPFLPAGLPGRPDSCPIARATGGYVGVDGVFFDDAMVAGCVAAAWETRFYTRHDGYIVALPGTLRRFVKDYDLGVYGRDALYEEAARLTAEAA
jgi:hypothetical protein